MGLGKVQPEVNLKILKAPSPSPHPAAAVGMERIITEHWNLGWGGQAEAGGHTTVINISSRTVSSWAEGEQLTGCSLPLKAQNKEAP